MTCVKKTEPFKRKFKWVSQYLGFTFQADVKGWIVYPKTHVEVLNPCTSECNYFEIMAFQDVIKVNWSHKGGFSSDWISGG